MKTSPYPLLKIIGVTVLGAALLLSACSKTHDASTTSTTSAPSAMTANAADTWNTIKTYSYQQKAEFAAKANEVAARLERDAASAKGAASKRLADARDDLRTAAAEVGNATANTWDTTKARVGSALQNVAE
jgi:hypothetical protein